MFSGLYNGSAKHAPDLKNVLDRSWGSGVKKIIVTGTSLEESRSAAQVAKLNGIKKKEKCKLMFWI